VKAAIMQPYFWPYPGYFQLIKAVDLFIVYDNIEYTKAGWINRNRLCRDGAAHTFSLPLKKASDFLDVRERELAQDFNPGKLLNQFKGAYQRAPYFAQTLPLVERVVRFDAKNLFDFLHHSICATCEHLGITTEIRVSSDVAIDHDLKKQDKVLALCRAVGASTYINLSGGVGLYSNAAFRAQGIELVFIRAKPFEYAQFQHPFVPMLSIIDLMMFNSIETVEACISCNYELLPSSQPPIDATCHETLLCP
jgi:WbqC-like protein family